MVKIALFTCLLTAPIYSFAQQDSATVTTTTDIEAIDITTSTEMLAVNNNLIGPPELAETLPVVAEVTPDDNPAPDNGVASDNRYHLKYAVDIPVTAVGTVWTLYAFGKVYDKPKSEISSIENLNKDDINGLDRWAAGMNDANAAKTSDYFFYGSIPIPFFLLLDKKVRHEAPRVGFMYLEAMAVTGLLYTGTNYFIDRYRPETYSNDKPASERVDGNYRNSFFAGHVALVGTATFFMAKIYNDYHPNNNFKYAMWGFAIAATGTTAYLRHKAGKHFPTDIAVGLAVGVLSGVLTPQFHKNKKMKDHGWGLSPAMINMKPGLCVNYRFK